jgi:acetyl-CoA C-acetyltransferase
MADIVIAGIGQTPVGEHWDTSLRSLALQAIQAAIRDSGGLKPQVLYVGNILAANLSRQAHLGALLADYAGLTGIEAETIEAGGASGGAALRQGYLAIASGLVDVALIVGVEKFTDVIGSDLEAALATLTDSDSESIHGLTLTAQAALLAGRYSYENHLPANALIGFPLTAHANGVANKNAMYRKAITLDNYQKAEIVSDPLNIYDIAPNADGAAALVMTRLDLLPNGFPHQVVRIAASAVASDTLSLAERSDPLWFSAAQASVKQAFQKAGLQREKVHLFEYYDAFSIFAALSLEAAGFAERGLGWKLARDGNLGLTSQIPCATLGGLIARGNPGGATGVYQAVEATLQLRDQAGEDQVAGARYALIQCLGGPASIAVSHILEKMGEQAITESGS